MFGWLKSWTSKSPDNPKADHEDKQLNQKVSDWEPGSEFSPAQASLIDSFKDVFIHIEEDITEWDLQNLSDEEMVAVIQELMRFIAMRINTKGEMSYIAKKTALFLAERLHGALRRDIKLSEVPPVHATVIDDMYNCIDATKTGLHSDPDVDIIEEDYNKNIKQILRKTQRKAGINIVLPS